MDNETVLNFTEEEFTQAAQECYPALSVEDGKKKIAAFISWALGK